KQYGVHAASIAALDRDFVGAVRERAQRRRQVKCSFCDLNQGARMSSNVLFRPFKLKGLNLPNRVVMAPMTRSFSHGGIPTEDVAQYYRRRAEGAVGLIILEGTGVEGRACLNYRSVHGFLC